MPRPDPQTLGSAEIRRMLSEFVRRRVGPSDVEDVVQTILVEALASQSAPEDGTELRKWLIGIARHKLVDAHRRTSRERPSEIADIPTSPNPVEDRELLHWAKNEARKSSKDADATLGWLARESQGDKLEQIAADEKIPAATVRQRVSRMRRFVKERWREELAAAAILAILVFALYRLLATKQPDARREEPVPIPSTVPTPLERAAELRRLAIPTCSDYPLSCLDQLDEAKRLDPAGDAAEAVQDARKRATEKLDRPRIPPPPPPTAVPTALPTASPTGESSASVPPPRRRPRDDKKNQ